MLLSALTLAAMLQAAPEIGMTGQPVGELTIPRKAKSVFLDKAPARSRFVFPAPGAFRHAPPLGFVRGPQAAGCRNNGLDQAGHPETLTVQPLSKMPKAHGELAVARLVDGCPVAVLIAQRAP